MNQGRAYPGDNHLLKDSVSENDAVEEDMKTKKTCSRVKELRN